MAAWIVCALCALIIIKPQEFVSALAGLPLLYVGIALAAVLIGLDVIWRRIRPAVAPQVPYVLAFLLWAALTTAVKRPDVLGLRATTLAISACVFLVVAVGAASPQGLRAVGATLLGCAILVTAVAIVQGYQPYVCMVPEDPEDWEGKGELIPDGRPCETLLDCRESAPDPEADYRCERAGPLKTSTIRGRVRYRGSLADPNELSLMVGMCIPFAFAFAERRARSNNKKKEGGAEPKVAWRAAGLPVLLTDRLLRRIGAAFRAIPVSALIVAVGLVIVLSQSRTGLIVYLVVLGLYFIRRMGPWGVVAGSIIGPPMILLGGRSGSEAEESAEERLELLREGLEMIVRTKGIGVGAGQFGDESSIGLTAHNTYLLAAAETGLVGMCLFGIALYASLKVPLAIWFGDHEVDGVVARFAPAIAVSLCGAFAGVFFLSWAYKDILYMVLGASAALYGVARAQDGRVSVTVSLKEAALVCAGMIGLLVLLRVLLRFLG